jgi:hypothetical protein
MSALGHGVISLAANLADDWPVMIEPWRFSVVALSTTASATEHAATTRSTSSTTASSSKASSYSSVCKLCLPILL